jgi:hypothetical protein
VTAASALDLEVLHEPRVWPEYHPNYYGGFVRGAASEGIAQLHC